MEQEDKTEAAQFPRRQGKAEFGMWSAALHAAESLKRIHTEKGLLDLVIGEEDNARDTEETRFL